MSKTWWFVILFSRLIINLGIRITYPFLPVIARGLGVSFEQAGLLVAVRHFVGLASVPFGVISDRKGHLWGMRVGLLMLLAGTLVVASSAHFLWALAGFILLGLSKTAYDPSVQAFISARTPYAVRARAMGMLESAWAGSWLLGIPLSGFLITRFGWQSPFIFLSAAALGALWFMGRIHSPDAPSVSRNEPLIKEISHPEEASSFSIRHLAVLGVSFFMVFANENLVIVYGAWMEGNFHLQPQALGFFSTGVGLAELAGEFTVVALVDRIGKRRAVMGGLVLTGLSYLTLPYSRDSLLGAFVCLTFMFYLSEFTIVSSFPYLSEWVSVKRGQWLALNYSFLVTGRLCGSLSGPWLWQRSHDLHLLAFLSILVQSIAFLLLLWAGAKKR